MQEMIVKNSRQLGLCLKLLYAEHEKFSVQISENNDKRMEYHIKIQTNRQRAKELIEKCRILMS